MPDLELLDELRVTVVAEDSVLYESPYLGQHGISLYLAAVQGDLRRNVLVDVGQNSEALLYNMKLMGIAPSSIDAVVLTHCHYDHTQGLAEVLKAIGKRDLPVVAHPDLFRLNFTDQPYLRSIGVPGTDSRARIEENGGTLFLTADPLRLMPGLGTTGYVPRQTDFEEAAPTLKTIDAAGRVAADPMADDISVLAATKNAGLQILTGCSHAGIVNIARRAQGLYPGVRLGGIIGGLHLVEASPKRIARTAAALKELDVGRVCAGHCTGFDAQAALRAVFGDGFEPLRTGMVFRF